MLNVLLIYDDRSAILTARQVLAKMMNIAPVHLVLEEFHPEFLFSEIFDLAIFELFGENRSCIAILKQLEKLAMTSGMEVPPIIVLTADDTGRIERDLRTTKANFFFVKPVKESDLIAAIEQSLLLPKGF